MAGHNGRMRGMTRSQSLGGIALPVVILMGLVALAFGSDSPTLSVALMVVGPALAAIVAPTAVAAVISGLTVVVAAVTAAATFGLRFGDALPALVWVIAISGLAVVLASMRPKIVVAPQAAPMRSDPVTPVPDLEDPITGLPTREAVLASHVGVLEGAARLVALLDVDDLAGVNDAHGHGIGDTLLFAIGGRTRWALDERPQPEDEIVARWGDDEFLIVISGVDDDACSVLDHIVSKVNDNQIRTDSGLIEATMSAGAVVWRPGEMLADAVRDARTRLHRAKARGAAQVEIDLSVEG